jgi:hypothetical protein
MLVKEEKHSKNYLVLDTAPLNDSKLSLSAAGLMSHICTHQNGWKIRLDDIRNRFKSDGRRAIQRAFAELSDAGYAVLESKRDEEGRISEEWWVFERPKTAMAYLSSGKIKRSARFRKIQEQKRQKKARERQARREKARAAEAA